MIQSIDQFHNLSPVHGFYQTNYQYSESLRKCFVKWHKSHLRLNDSENYIYSSLSSRGFWHGFDLSKNSIFNELRSSLLSKHTLHEKNQYSIHSLNAEELYKSWQLLQSQRVITEAIYKYIADQSMFIHESYLFLRRRCTPSEPIQTSGFWHRDAMGTRLKVFICLDNVNGTPGTSVVGHPYLDPLPHQWEMIRASNASYDDKLMQQLTQTLLSMGPTTINQETGSIMILDTNTIHRGEYQHTTLNEKNSLGNSRALIVLSFIARDAYALYSKVNHKPYAHDPISVPGGLFQSIPLASPPFHPLTSD